MCNRVGMLIFNHLIATLTNNSAGLLPLLLPGKKGAANPSVSSISVGSADTIALLYQGLSCAHHLSAGSWI